ncbi:DUF3592 domain-containing protein [Microlunatus speluncae]|uniref:DUF3592 domain-containing protein n=1 Tax=Microlunatus speluncae TaxID=2594267 RepID=UPI0012663BC5|nr:DUF3592 domain-containing protein [Microlunatus speluncae]
MVGRRTVVTDRTRGFGGLVIAVLILLTGCVVVLTGATPAHACSCEAITRAEAAEQADVIIFGTVRSVRPVADPASGRELVVEVRYVYKGTAYAEQVVQSPDDAAACGFAAEPGTTMVIYATERSDPATEYAYELMSTACAGNVVTDTAPRGLGQPEAPTPGSSADVGSAERTNDLIGRLLLGIGLGALGLVIIVGGALFWLWRPGRPNR